MDAWLRRGALWKGASVIAILCGGDSFITRANAFKLARDRYPSKLSAHPSCRQVALIAAEREVLSLRSQLSHRQQHIKLLEQRLLEQSQVRKLRSAH